MSASSALEAAPVETADESAETRAMEQEQVKEGEGQAGSLSYEGEQVSEQRETEGTGSNRQQSTLTPALSQREREKDEAAARLRETAVERIRQATGLPPVLKERLAVLVEASGETAADGKVQVSIDDAMRAVEEALPEFLRLDRSRVSQQVHPGGDTFFSGEPSELSDAQAEELARGQLARSGLLRGQRVRVAE